MLVKLSLAILCFMAVNVVNPVTANYQIEKLDVSDPSCKYVLSEIVKADRRLLDLTSFIPAISAMADKYSADKGKRVSRGLTTILKKIDHEYLSAIYDHIDIILNHAEPCLLWIRKFLKFWIHRVTARILTDQITGFLS
ncbi:uncharacterized protein LOC115879398 isoform X3 [Sitophilus oryzae]|uniref:Uncharacterized protein LOC115879398 isoform X3 n=1 Tax=Sitophilus oryzae TaxID=7048 RepID=A0A6J2XMJ4_SITOR|nr:uncharacterized protein LOC115879398 isoform X3 [Sitophilus oryzae]